ncbi:MAG: MBL fold metallo-hydrolase [Bacteroidetes bacterium SW_4_67_19]|nr:MAG: MBL fold metallo-hydrolase [Bacteroidetes bacterium SW_4_67_19]
MPSKRVAEQEAGAPARADPPAPTVRATLLGTGTSTGVPVLGCDCAVCTSDDPRDQRLRSSCHLVVRPRGPGGCDDDAVHLQIDTGPDFRRQALRYGVERVDAVLYTHAHFDHVTGLDDLRPFFFQNAAPAPCFARPHTAKVLRRMFPHVFVHDDYPNASNLELHEITEDALAGVGRFAYLTDASAIPDASFDQLDGQVDTLVIDALHRRDHPTHFSIEEATRAARRIGARATYFTHLTHSVRHAEEEPRLPEGIHLAYDGLRLQVEGGKALRAVESER